jgi:hypothetical protein
MQQSLALSLLKIREDELSEIDFENLSEEKVFEFKNQLFSVGRVHPKILKTRIEKAQKVYLAICFLLSVEPSEAPKPAFEAPKFGSITEFFINFEASLAKVKLKIANALTFPDLITGLNELYLLEVFYFKSFETHYISDEIIQQINTEYPDLEKSVQTQSFFIPGNFINFSQANGLNLADIISLKNWLFSDTNELKLELIKEIIRVKLVLKSL